MTPLKVLRPPKTALVEVRPIDDPALIANALRDGERWAQHALLTQYTEHVERILIRVLGNHTDLDDLVQEVFVRCLERIEELRVPGALRSWLTSIAVYIAREAIRRKKRRKWLLFMLPEEIQELEMPLASPEARAAIRALYEVVGRLGADEQIAFTLRFIEGMELTEIAAVCDVSLATIKRRLKRAEAEFFARGREHDALAAWFEEGTRWR
jgi:RNA polymerase sigma-70 factor (ECF subfamily)